MYFTVTTSPRAIRGSLVFPPLTTVLTNPSGSICVGDAETERAVFDVDALVAVREEGIEEKALVSNAKSATKAARHITLLLRIIAGIMISYVFYRLSG